MICQQTRKQIRPTNIYFLTRDIFFLITTYFLLFCSIYYSSHTRPPSIINPQALPLPPCRLTLLEHAALRRWLLRLDDLVPRLAPRRPRLRQQPLPDHAVDLGLPGGGGAGLRLHPRAAGCARVQGGGQQARRPPVRGSCGAGGRGVPQVGDVFTSAWGWARSDSLL